jgi:hypothetical protein
MQKFVSFFNQYKGISIGVISLLVAALFSAFPPIADAAYRNGIFQVVRIVMDFTVTLLPFPLIIVLLVLLPFFLFFYFKKKYSNKWHIIILPLNVLGWLVSLFLLMWGYNYTCNDSLPAHYSRQITTRELYDFGLEVAIETNKSRTKCEDVLQMVDDSHIRAAMEAYIKQQGFKDIGQVKCKDVKLGGVMRRLGVAGIYFPFTGESYCDGTFPPLVKMFIKAHEMSHGYGVTDEGEADYFAYKALRFNTTEPLLQYAAELELLRSIRSQLYYINDSLRVELDQVLNPRVRDDLREIRENTLRYKEFFPGAQTAMNDKYLKLMGIEQGVNSYDQFIEHIWHERQCTERSPQ